MNAVLPPAITPFDPAQVPARGYTVAVRNLCDFTAKQGDLDLRFTPGLKKAFDKLHRQWNSLVRDQPENYQAYDRLPDPFILALQKASAEMTELFAQQPTRVDSALQSFHFEALVFLRLAELHGAHSLFDISREEQDGVAQRSRVNSTLCIRNVVPGPHLKDRWAGAHAVTLFSATLTPQQYLMDMLGLPETTAWLDVPSAFSAQQLQVQVARQISTRYQDRQHSLDGLVARPRSNRP